MRESKIKLLCLLIITGFFFQSCSEEGANLDTAAEEFRNNDNRGQGGNGNNGGQGGNGNNGNNGNNDNNGGENLPVDALDNDILEDWTDLFLEVERYAAGMRPTASARAIAYIYLTAYETAVPGMRRYSSYDQSLSGLQITSPINPNGIDYELALNTAFARSIDHFLINVPSVHNAKINALDLSNEETLTEGLSTQVISSSQNWGTYVANQIIAYSQTDTEAEEQILEPQPESYEPPTGEGYWTYSDDPERALFPYWESVRTFVISTDETTTVAPVAYSENQNSNYFRQMREVYNVNNEAKEDQNDELHIAEFWSDDVEGLMMSPPARQVSIANQLIEQYDLDLQESLIMFLKVGFSLNDAAVSTWKYKYEHMVMRPNVFIHEFIDPDFQTNLYKFIYWPNPSFPGYPSGHSCFASAAAGVFINQFGDRTNFTDRTHQGRTEFLGEPRSFDSFRDMADENGYSRIPLGVHVRMDCTEGLRLGYEISDAVNDIDLRQEVN